MLHIIVLKINYSWFSYSAIKPLTPRVAYDSVQTQRRAPVSPGDSPSAPTAATPSPNLKSPLPNYLMTIGSHSETPALIRGPQQSAWPGAGT